MSIWVAKKCGRVAVLFLCAVLSATSLSGCGKKNESTVGTYQDDEGDYVYQPKTISLTYDANQYVTNFDIVDDKAYYILGVRDMDKTSQQSPVMYCMDLTQDIPTPQAYITLATEQSEDGYIYCTDHYLITESGDLLSTVYGYKDTTEQSVEDIRYFLCKQSKDGKILFHIDISEYTSMDREHDLIQCISEDKKGNIFISNGCTYIWVFDAQGKELQTVHLEGEGKYENFVNEFGRVSDGRVAYVSYNLDEHALRVYDEVKKDFSNSYDNLPTDYWRSNLASGLNEDVMLCGNNGLYNFNLESNTYAEILQWLEVDLNGQYVHGSYPLSNGSIAIMYQNLESVENSVIILSKVPVSEVKEKETVTLSCIRINQNVQQQVVRFNKLSDDYEIVIKNYGESINWSSNTCWDDYNEAMLKFQNDLISGYVSDMFVASDIDMGMLMSKGVIEDLNPYLEKSTELSKEDFIHPVLDAYTIDGKLCTIPVHFIVQTICGRTSELGEGSGWSMADMIRYAGKYPEAKLFPCACNTLLADYCLMYDFESYVNWSNGECHFQSDDFRMLLELAKQYPSGLDVDFSASQSKAIRNHEVLLEVSSFGTPIDWQVTQKVFNEPITAIGFPSSRSTGVLVKGEDGICINALSEHKDISWEFIESFFKGDVNNSNVTAGFETLKDRYDTKMQEAMTAEYRVDENGNQILDRDGNPIELPKGGLNMDGVIVDVYSVKQEEADAIWHMIEQIDGTVNYNTKLLDIVNEELIPYFNDQKSMDDVIEIIQNRVQVYVNESQ